MSPACPLPAHRPERHFAAPRRNRAALGWAASAIAVALGLSTLAALAMAVVPPGQSAGETAQPLPILLPPPAVTIGALSEAAPQADAAPPEPDSAPEPDTAPSLPASFDPTPPRPQPPAPAPQPLAEAVPVADAPAPLPPPEPKKPIEKPAEKPVEKPAKKKAEKPAEKPKTAKKSKPAEPPSQAAAAAAPAAKPAAQSAGKGKASAASYGAEVMKKIRKTGKRKTAGRGTAVVGFAISASGGLAAAKLVRSSGNPAVDQAALDHIRRAAPFPPPPPGAETRFSFEYVSK